MKMTIESRARYWSMAFKRCAEVIWNSLKTNTDEKLGKKKMSIRSQLTFIWLPSSAKKGQHFQIGEKLQKKKKKTGSHGPTVLKWFPCYKQPRYNGAPVYVGK